MISGKCLPPIAGVLSLACAALAGCSNPLEDVRVTLCKDMIAGQLESAESLTWQGAETETRGHQGAIVTVRFASADRNGDALCHYDHDAPEDTAITLANPLAAYSTSPSSMSLDGRILTRSELAHAVHQAMAKQGLEFVERARDAVRGATETR